MMMAYGHGISGWCGAMIIINALSLYSHLTITVVIVLALLSALAMAGATIITDWDHRNSTITTAFGPLSLSVHQLVIELHYTVCSLTSNGGDKKPPGPHRGVTHWYPFPLAIGGLVSLGCWISEWVLFGVLIVLYTGAIRALTVPDYIPRPKDTIRHRWTMQCAHSAIDLLSHKHWAVFPVAIGFAVGWLTGWSTKTLTVYTIGAAAFIGIVFVMGKLKRARRVINRTKRIGGYWVYLTIPVGKFITVLIATILALIAIRFPYVTDNGYWLGVLVCIGMYLHILGDAPTEMGIPGKWLTDFWRLPKWLAFRAGGPFEILGLWIPMTGLGIYLIPGLRPREEVLMVQTYLLYGLTAFAIIAVIVEATYRIRRSRRKVLVRV